MTFIPLNGHMLHVIDMYVTQLYDSRSQEVIQKSEEPEEITTSER